MNIVTQPNSISKGCQLCQQGKWLCIFITYRCNSSCHFCSAPFRDDHVHSAFGNKKEEILLYLLKTDFRGISFSGGDPFLVFERLLEWFLYFKKNLPDYYFWVYTNGEDADRRKLEQLSSAGMDEIRFNIAASGYISEKVWECIRIARSLFPFVSVEIPSIEKDSLLLKTSLKFLEEVGVDYLNLHDYILSESDPATLSEPPGKFILNKTIHLKYALSSIENTQNILETASLYGYHFDINHCSMQQKELQMTLRRIKVGQVFMDHEYDIMTNDGIIYNYFVIPDEIYTDDLEQKILKPDFLDRLRPYLVKIKDLDHINSTGHKIFKLSYIPQLEIQQDKRVIGVSVVSNVR
jgi:pyruvate formate-lyase activating enzyme-like uncharacterized protein